MKPTPYFDALLAQLKRSRKPGSKELVRVFELNLANVSQHFESCIPDLDGKDYWQWTVKICPIQEFHGPQFHKGFRQCDICATAEEDMIIWKILGALASDKSKDHTFWLRHHQILEPLNAVRD